jgi:flagellum-specific ATP synthase
MSHYPAIDIEASISRAMNDITSQEHQEMARAFKHLYSIYQQNRDLISVGAYERGTDERIDAAIDAIPLLDDFLRQDMHVQVSLEQSIADLTALFPPPPTDMVATG